MIGHSHSGVTLRRIGNPLLIVSDVGIFHTVVKFQPADDVPPQFVPVQLV